MKCQYVFKKGDRKGKVCLKHNCRMHKSLHKKGSRGPVKKEAITTQTILNLETNSENKNTIMKYFESLQKLDINTTEYFKTQLFVDQSTSIPWNIYYNIRDYIGLKELSSIECLENRSLIREFIETITCEFDKEIYAMDNVKNEIINYICKFITNPHSQSNNIALFGAAGVCKTKFVKVLSSVLKLPMKTISLGGMKDTSYLLGHSQTYQDSKCGIIAQSIIDCGVMNPIIYFDELDKVSNGEYGQDIYGVLSNLTDPTINTSFKDRYFSNLAIDLSQVFYIFTFNDITKVNKILLDRLNTVYVESPSKKDKIVILRDYCFDDIVMNIGFPKSISLDDTCYTRIVEFTEKQIDNRITSGIRESSRILEKILLEINKDLLMQRLKEVDTVLHIDLETFMAYFVKLQHQFLQVEEGPSHMYM